MQPNECIKINDLIMTFRYDGLDAEKHTLELGSLSESLKGFSKILVTVGTFAATQKYIKNTPSQEVKIYAKEARANCFSLDTVMDFVNQYQLLSGGFGAILTVLVSYVFAKNSQKKDEMKALKDSLDKAIEALGNKDRDTIDGLLKVIDKMASDLRPAVRQASSPIGVSCNEMSIKSNIPGHKPTIITQKDKEEIDKLEDDELIGIAEYRVFVTNVDVVNKTAKVIFEHDESHKRVNADVIDPAFCLKNSPYINALSKFNSSGQSTDSIVTITAKATAKGGRINKLFIVDIS
ncbi:hypothetical protein ACGABU_003558 [Morganella morganii]|uniref:DUF7946 domain-containing protein n=1 Tax=Enterobacterales TaxID=91347 RepID=UPI002023AD33|nr:MULTISPECIES: hypothetical protein [Enterobacterales]